MRAELRKSASALELPPDFLEGGPPPTAFVSRADLAAIHRDWDHADTLRDAHWQACDELGEQLYNAAEILGFELPDEDDGDYYEGDDDEDDDDDEIFT
jgi:hypothetical protein